MFAQAAALMPPKKTYVKTTPQITSPLSHGGSPPWGRHESLRESSASQRAHDCLGPKQSRQQIRNDQSDQNGEQHQAQRSALEAVTKILHLSHESEALPDTPETDPHEEENRDVH